MWRDVWLIAGLGLRRSLRDKSILIQGVIAPILVALVVGSAFGAGFSVNATIGIADADGSQLSRQIASNLTGSGGDGIAFTTVTGDPEVAMSQGSYDAVLVLPAGLGEAVMAGGPADLQVVGEATNPLASSIAQSVAGGVAASLQTARITAVAANEVNIDPTVAIQEAVSAAPPLTVEPGEVQGAFSVMAYFAPGIAMLFLFFIIGNGARSIVVERKEGTLPRILAAPVAPAAVLLGKTVQVMVVGVFSMTTVWLVTWLGFGASWGQPLGVFLVIVAAVTAIAGISLLITGIARTENQADALTTILALLFAVAGGTFFYGASGTMSALAQLTPNGQALAALVDLAAAQASAVDVLPRVLSLVVLGVVTAGVGLVALRKKVLT